MAKPAHIVPDHTSLPAPAAALPLGDIFRYASLILEIIGLFKGAGSLAVGESEPVPEIKAVVNGKHFTWNEKGITRTA